MVVKSQAKKMESVRSWGLTGMVNFPRNCLLSFWAKMPMLISRKSGKTFVSVIAGEVASILPKQGKAQSGNKTEYYPNRELCRDDSRKMSFFW